MRFVERLFDTNEAKNWNGAYPLGNGSLGVMVDGGATRETFYFNDDSFWSGSSDSPTFRANNVYDEVKKATMSGDLNRAEELLYKDVYGEYAESYIPLCEMHITKGTNIDSSYSRTLDLSRAVSLVKQKDIVEEAIASHKDNIFYLHIMTAKSISYAIAFSSLVHNDITYNVENNVGYIRLYNIAPSHLDPVGHPQAEPIIYDETKESIHAIAKTRIYTDGVISSSDEGINIDGASYINIIMAATTSYRNPDNMETKVDKTLDEACGRTYEEILSRHIADYESLYGRTKLLLGANRLGDDITTRDALKKHHKHPDVATLLFNYARYLMISASREDSYCTNLQGIWNNVLTPPWSSAFTVNINIEMNYWIAESANLSECHMPLMRQLKVLEKSGRRTAREQLNNAGWCCGHNSDIWGHSNLTGRISKFNPTMYALYLSGGAWLATHIYRHYEATGDKEFLREYYYILRGVAEFYLDYLEEDNESNYLVMSPSASPENTFILNGERHSLSKNATMDTAICRHIFNIVEKCSEILGQDSEFATSCAKARERLYPYKIGKHGELVEWYDNYKETEKTHRHISHLYGLYPDSQITLESTPDLAEACRTTIKRRGNKGIGWSLAWRVCMLARLREGEKAIKTLYQKTKYYDPKKGGLNYGGCYDNLFSAPPMQIDGNFGIAAGIIEMLLQSYDTIRLLPALPKAWADGSFEGLCTKDGYRVSCVWRGGLVTRVKVLGKGESVNIIANDKEITIPLNKEITL